MAEVTLIYLPLGDHGQDQGVDEYLAAGHTEDDLLALRTPELRDPPEGDDGPDGPNTQSAVLVRFGEEADLFHSPDGETYATVEAEGHRETHAVRSKGLRLWLVHRFYEQFGKPPGPQALQDALGVLEAKALFEGEEHPVYVRVAEHEGAVYVDLTNEAWEAVKITPEGFEVVSDPPVRFRRRKGMLALPHPVKGGKVDALRQFVNVRDEAAWCLLLAWLVQAFRPKGPYPILILQGEQGSAKTTLARILKAIVDPSTAPVRSAPRGEHDLVIAANNSWVVALDNLSGLPPWLSDALCRLSTGGGFGTRKLYENDEETLFDATRPVVLNGITEVATRADLLDRSIILALLKILEEDRMPEDELWRKFRDALPGILGGIFEAVSIALRNLPETTLPRLPRMADFALFATAAEEGLGMKPGEFMETYDGSRKETNELALESDSVAVAVVKLMEGKDEWVGTASKLLNELRLLTDETVRRTRTWPQTPHHLAGRLTRLAPVLRGEGIGVENLERKAGERKKRLFKIKPENERHRRHERHEEEANSGISGSTDDAHDAAVTLGVDEEPKKRQVQTPIEQPETMSYDADVACDAVTQPLFKGSLVATEEEMQALIPEILRADLIALDLESTGLDPRKDRIRLLSIATERGTWLVDNSSINIRGLFEALEDKTLVVHNAMFDVLFLRHLGYVHHGRIVDTMTISRMVHAGERGENGKRLEHSLESCCERELGLKLNKTYQDADWSGELSEEMIAYAAEDAEVLLPLHEILVEKVRETGQERAYEIEERALLAGIEMAHNGVGVDKERWLGIVEEAGKGLTYLRAQLDGLVCDPPEEVKKRNATNKNVPDERKDRWNWDSPDQIKAAAATMGLTLHNTSMDQLKLIDHEFARALLAYRKVRSGLATYGEKFFEPTEDGREVYLNGRLYPSWGMCQADTGRMSCSSPNVQNIPNKSRLGKLRGCVVAPEGRRLVKADYSQVELRIVAKVASEEAMLEAYRAGEDLHLRTARGVLGHEEVTKDDRQLAKGLNFGLLYGQGAEGLKDYVRDKYGVEMDLHEAERYRERWFETYPAIRAWHRREGSAFDTGDDSSSTLAGRQRKVKSFTEKVNHPVQGTGADGLKLAIALFHERLPDHLEARLVLAVHDELVVECPEAQAEEVAGFVEEVMVEGMDEVLNPGLYADHRDRVPVEVEVEIAKSWEG
ncbi:MAG: DNA polymerase [Actinomycetota bacterium]|nr:DNA polymerase [Actinomycetota bacterium]